MAGPTASILFNQIPSDIIWMKIEKIIKSISSHVEGNDFWVISTKPIQGNISTLKGRPFSLEKRKIDSNYYEYSKNQISLIADLTGFYPKFDLGIYAMVNTKNDHKILGELILYIADKFNGLIDFGGQLSNPPMNLKGKIWEIPYESSEKIIGIFHLADPDFLRQWLKNSKFEMIK